MTAYIVFLLIIIMEWMLFFPNAKVTFGKTITYKQKKKYLVLVCMEMICFAGFRSIDLGADTTAYLDALRYYSCFSHDNILKAELVWPFDFEAGYFMLTKLAAWLSFDETTFLFLIAILIYVPVCWFILQYSENPLLSILSYFTFLFGYSIGIFRQMIAISIVLLGTKYIWERKLIKYLITVGIAMTFHTTAIIVLPLYWICRIKLENKLKWIFAGEVICFFFARALVLLAVRLVPMYSGYVSGIYDVQGGSYAMLILLNIVMIAGFILEKNKENRENLTLRMSVNAVVIAVFLQIVGYSMGIFGRIVPYYSIYLIILIPFLLNRYFRKNIVSVHVMGVVVLVALFCFFTVGSVIDPYQFVF